MEATKDNFQFNLKHMSRDTFRKIFPGFAGSSRHKNDDYYGISEGRRFCVGGPKPDVPVILESEVEELFGLYQVIDPTYQITF